MELSNNLLARLSGLVYLLLILTGIYGLVYVPSVLFDWDNPAATAKNILENEMTFRLAVTAETACFILNIFLPLLLFKLLHKVNKEAGILMVAFSLLSVPITLTHIAKHVDVLLLLKEQEYLKAMTTDIIQAHMMLNLASFNSGIVVANILWGLWLLPFGYLVYKSGFLPRILGVFLMLGCIGYLIEFVGKFIFSLPHIPWYIGLPSSLGEFGICLWLIIIGARSTIYKKTAIAQKVSFS